MEQKIQIGAPNPHSINERFSFNQFILVFLVTIIPPKAKPLLRFLHTNPHTQTRIVTIPSFALTKGYNSKRRLRNSTRWPIYIINSVDNEKLLRNISSCNSDYTLVKKVPTKGIRSFVEYIENTSSRKRSLHL